MNKGRRYKQRDNKVQHCQQEQEQEEEPDSQSGRNGPSCHLLHGLHL